MSDGVKIIMILCIFQSCTLAFANDNPTKVSLADLSRQFSQHLENKEYKLAEKDQRQYLRALTAENATAEAVSRAQIVLAQVLTHEKKFVQAEEAWSAALTLNPSQTRQIQKQKAELLASVGHFRESEDLLISLCQADKPESSSKYNADLLELGNVYLRDHDYLHAEQTYRTLVNLIEDAHSSPTIGTLTAYLMLAITLKDSGKFHESFESFVKCLGLASSIPGGQCDALRDQCFNGLSFIYRQNECKDRAEIQDVFRRYNRKLISDF